MFFIQLLWARNGHCFTNWNITWPTISYVALWRPLSILLLKFGNNQSLTSARSWPSFRKRRALLLWLAMDHTSYRSVPICLHVCLVSQSRYEKHKKKKRNCFIVMINHGGGNDNQGTYLSAVTCVMMTSQPWRPVGTVDKIWLKTGWVKIKVAHYSSLTLCKTTYFYGTFNMNLIVAPCIS